MTDKINQIIEELKLCDTHEKQYEILKIFSFKSFYAGMEAGLEKTHHVSVLHRAINMLKKKIKPEINPNE